MRKHSALLILSLTGLLAVAAPAMSASAAWKNTAQGRIYTQKASPGYVTGMKTIKGYTYYFNDQGIMQTGVHSIDRKLYYFDQNGRLQFGWITAPNGKVYYADKKGVLAQSKWVQKHYLQADGTMAVNTWVNGKQVGADGLFTGLKRKVGWITVKDKLYYFDAGSTKVRGWLTLGGDTYYLNPSSGALVKGWFKVGTKTYFSNEKTGVVRKSVWKSGKYLKSNGIMATGKAKIDGKVYLFDSSGSRENGWVTYKGVTYYCVKGVIQMNTWVENNTKYLTSSGARASGWTTIGNATYYFDPATGVRKTGWIRLDNKRYYISASTGLRKAGWIKNKYYATDTGAVLTGLNTVGGALYYFNTTTGKKLTSTLKTIDSVTYYFQSDGRAVKEQWITISSKYYYFQADGSLAKNTWIGEYYVDANGARTNQTKKTGWQTVNGLRYYFDSDGNMVTGWQKISGNQYYFDQNGAMLTGIQTIGSQKHYFYSDGRLAVSITIAVGTKLYTINSSGIITKEESMKITENTVGAQIVNFALQYVGNRYVYGGTSLTNGADCSGFVQTVFKNFGISLLRVADDQMHGPSTSQIKNYGYKAAVVVDISSIQPGDLLFYGSGDYASHVAIYMGDGQIVHASNSQPYPQGGIKVSNYDYNTPIRAVRYWA